MSTDTLSNATQPSSESLQDQATVLVIDDTRDNLTVIGEILSKLYRVRLANSGQRGLKAARTEPRPDLILLDIMMPEMDGYQVLEQLKADATTREIPVIFVTALNTDEDEEAGLRRGAVDYISKPIHPAILQARVKTHLALKRALDQVKDQNQALEAIVQARTAELQKALDTVEKAHTDLRATYFGVLRAFGELMELRGGPVGTHCQRVADISRRVAAKMGLNEKETQDVFIAALLHDVGKMGFPDNLLSKPVSQMNPEELAIYRRHPTIAADVLRKINTLAGVTEIIQAHHEHYDGTGFPFGTSALNIPIGARIIAAVSDYDNLKNGMLTREPMTSKQSCQYLLENMNGRYDPLVIQVLEPILSSMDKFEIEEIPVRPAHLHEGAILTRDLMHPDGFVLLSKNTVLTRRLIDQLVSIDTQAGTRMTVFIQREKDSPAKNP